MKHSESIGNIAKALVEVQRELAPIGKDSVNPHFKTKYASLDKLTEIVRPILCKHDIAIMQGGAEQDDKGITVETKLLHSSGEWISGTYRLPMEKTNPQGAGSAITYARRYGLGSILALTTDDDDDANEASKPRPVAKAQPAKTPEAAYASKVKSYRNAFAEKGGDCAKFDKAAAEYAPRTPPELNPALESLADWCKAALATQTTGAL